LHNWKLLTLDVSDLLKNDVIALLKRINDSEKTLLRTLGPEKTCIGFAKTLAEGELSARTVISRLPHPEVALV